MTTLIPTRDRALRAIAFYLSALLVALALMALLPALVVVRLATALHIDAAAVSGRTAWVPGVQVTMTASGGAR